MVTAVAVATGLAVAMAPAARAVERPAIRISGGLTEPVFSYRDAVREYVRVQSPVDSDGDGRKDLIRADIVRPRESGSGLRVPVIMHASPYFDVGVGTAQETKAYDQSGNATNVPLFYHFLP
jgi:X-Pro dipeptidyl-peptidase